MLSDDEQEIVDRVAWNAKLLNDGYHERVEYTVPVKYHKFECMGRSRISGMTDGCECPVANEQRVREVKRPGLLRQLRDFAANKDTDRNPKAERGAPRVKVPGRPPGDMGGFFTLDEIECDIPRVIDQALETSGRDRTWACGPVTSLLTGIANQVSYMLKSGHPDTARDIDKAAERWVKQARDALRITVGDAMFSTVVCGNCGGGLSTPWGNTGDSDVRCIGSLDAGPCGETYPVTEWLRLYEDHQRRKQRDGQMGQS